ncbi:MAG: hypothetical protein M1830_006575 [Pleopsidium flavum]|nr:MAG: hypothetical protein M1830_006575 [Pleopsidium flavum]
MSDADLEEIRRARLTQLQQQGSNNNNGASSGGGGGGGGQEDQRKQQEASARTSLLSQILLPEAADRLGRIRLVKESRATDVENRLIMLAKSGQLREKVTEEQLKELLGAVREGRGEERIVVSRRKGVGWDEEGDGDDDLFGR